MDMNKVMARLEQLNDKVISLMEGKFDNERRIIRLENEMRQKTAEVKALEKKLNKVKCLQDEVTNVKKELQEHKKQIQAAQDKCQKFDKLQVVLNSLALKRIAGNQEKLPAELNSDVEQKLKDMKTKTNATSSQVELLTNKMASIEDVNKSFELFLSESEESDGRVRSAFNDLQKQVDQNNISILSIRNMQDVMEKTGFLVDVDNSTQLKTDARTRLDRCQKVWQASPGFDQASCWFTVPLNGIYQFNVTVSQLGKGRLYVGVGPEDGTHYVAFPYVPAGWTDVTDDACSGNLMVRLTKGRRISVWIKRTLGDAKVSWCRVSGCLVCPGPAH